MLHPTTTPGAVSPGVPHAGDDPTAAAAGGPRLVDINKLPYSLRSILSWLPESEWHLVQSIICHGSLSREIVEIAKFVDAVWTNSLKAEDRRNGRVTGAERDAYRDGVEDDLVDMVTRSVALGKRSRLTEILQRSRPLIVRYVPETSAKPAGRNGERGQAERRSDVPRSQPARPAPAPAAPSGPEFLNRWLASIRKIRQGDPTFTRAAEVVSMFEKAIELAGPRRGEVEHMLAQYREAMRHSENQPDDLEPAAEAAGPPEATTEAA